MAEGARRILLCGALAMLVAPTLPAHAQSERAELGVTGFGLPGWERIHLPETQAPAVAIVASAGYGITESQGAPAAGAHHRAAGALGVGAALTPFFGFGLRLDGRHDLHPDDGMGADSGTVGDPRLLARGGGEIGDGLQLGAEALLWLPGENAPSLQLSAASVDAKLTFAFVPRSSSFRLALQAGYRFDQSANAAPDVSRLRRGDRLLLGLSDFDAVLLGFGLAYQNRALELLCEASWDVLVGSGAPLARQSPLRIALGARYHATAAIQLGAIATIVASSRPEQEPDDPLLPIEPRFALQLSAAYRFGGAPRPEPEHETAATEEPQAATKPVAPAPAAPRARVEGRLVDRAGAPIPDARVRLSAGGDEREATSDPRGEYAFDDVPLGPATLEIERDGYEPQQREIEVAPGAAPLVVPDAVLEASAAEPGQLRGLALSFSGKPLAAQLRVAALGPAAAEPRVHELRAEDNGRFALELPEGRYEVKVSAPGHQPQTRTVQIRAGSVVILNLDLRKAER